MFQKYALLINAVLLGFCGCKCSIISTYVIQMVPIGVSSNFEWCLSSLLSVSHVLVFICLVSVVFIIIASIFTTVKIGRPLLESLTIGYKYGHSDTVSVSAIQGSNKLFPTKDRVQICYERKSGPFGLAYGIAFSEELTGEEKSILISHGYKIFKTKSVCNAVYVSSPALPWLSHIGQWLVLSVIYPKLYKYSKAHKLSAYPVVELYRRFSVTLIAPLSQQDVFVVPEAEPSMHRSMSHIQSDSSVAERSLSTSYHTSRVKLSETDVPLSTPQRSLSPVEPVNTVIPRLSMTPLGSSYTAKIILKQSLTPVANNDVAKPIIVRTSTPIQSKGQARGE